MGEGRKVKMAKLNKFRDTAIFYLNGKPVQARGEELFLSLAEFLRHWRAKPGTKIVCAEGDCGACSVLKASADRKTWLPINSCILSVGQCDGEHFVTIEGIQNGEDYHPVQKAMLDCHASQCGYCTPGFVTTMCGLLDGKSASALSKVDGKKIQNALTGNLCRCTGYQPIIDAGVRAAGECVKKSPPDFTRRYLGSKLESELKKATRTSLVGGFENRQFFAPQTLRELFGIRKRFPRSILIAAGTDLGVAVNKGRIEPEVFISTQRLVADKKWSSLKLGGSRLRVGSGVTLSQLRRELKSLSTKKKWQLTEIISYLDIFASPQIKNAATLIGNIANASPIGDMPPLLLTLDASLEIAAASGKVRKLPLSEFFKAYKKTALRPGDVILSVEFDLPILGEILSFRKVTQRRDLDISCVNGSFRARRDKKGKLELIRVAMGGVGPTPLRMKKCELQFLKGNFKDDGVVATFHSEMTPIADLRGSAAYRRVLAEKMLKGFQSRVLQEGLK